MMIDTRAILIGGLAGALLLSLVGNLYQATTQTETEAAAVQLVEEADLANRIAEEERGNERQAAIEKGQKYICQQWFDYEGQRWGLVGIPGAYADACGQWGLQRGQGNE